MVEYKIIISTFLDQADNMYTNIHLIFCFRFLFILFIYRGECSFNQQNINVILIPTVSFYIYFPYRPYHTQAVAAENNK